ncbi:FimV/HubP family polar landmark protein [Psychromonas hadalis]|uniref:FimV/HubP family polar landmark protein n=1 Tax=Psychromonas hadalis TaxID=211669 RepID=UPI0003B4059F|nr:FimV/HubP family polar landmark protein [Psychromonas hadalis]
MKRLLLSLIFCSPLLFSPSVSSISLVGPSEGNVLSAQQSVEQYGPVSRAETLWAISSKLRPDNSVSVQQTMVALYKLNPYAFFKGNINKIIPESMLTIPSSAFVAEQTDAEAIALIRKYSPNKKTTSVATPKPSLVEKKEALKVPEKESVKVDAAVVAENALNREKLDATEKKFSALQAEMELVNEQFIIATEASQALKLKLQPLHDEITLLTEQLEAETVIQKKLQQIIDDYRAQLDAVELPPFSGEGMINEILRLITASMTNLLIVIISPILLLLLIFMVISRIRSKRQLAEQEQEIAESTAILMEETGQFDELLTEGIADEAEQELDFTEDEEQSTESTEVVDIDELDSLALPDEIEEVNLTESDALETIVDLTEDEELVTSEEDPFGIGALTDDEELISSVDLDDDEPETSEEDPFGIGALTEEIQDEALISSVDLDVNEPEAISVSEQADLDLAAEWEAQVSADSSESDLDLSSALEEVEFDAPPRTTETLSENELSKLDSLQESTELERGDVLSEASNNDIAPADLDLTELADELPAIDIDDLDETLNTVESNNTETLPATEIDDLAESEALTDLDLTELVDEFPALDIADLEEALEVETKAPLPELESGSLPESELEPEANDLLAKQLSDVAFNEEVPLPKVDSGTENNFIDIETLLENSDNANKEEPYGELALDLGLEEFPDVVDLQGDVDIDDDENGIGAQLDLARAYLEIDDKAGAKEILLSVLENSNGKQRVEIDKLLSRLE